ncbi:FG-GAP repeat domain-containing protein [Pseudomonadota bacterium]
MQFFEVTTRVGRISVGVPRVAAKSLLKTFSLLAIVLVAFAANNANAETAAKIKASADIECVLRIPQIILSDGFEGTGPIRSLHYTEPVPIENIAPVGGLSFGNENLNFESYTADLNGDQLLDIITHLSPGARTPAPPSPIQILFNTGEGGLVDCSEELVVGDTPTMEFVRNILVDDFNGDGKMDIFFSNSGEEYQDPKPCEQNRLLLSDSEGKLRDVTSTHLPQLVDFSHGSSAADVDLDGDIDIYVVNLGCVSTLGSYLMKNNGSGQFAIVAGGEPFVHAYFSYEGPTWSAFVDFDKDGDPDLFAAAAVLLSESNEEQVVNVVLVNDGLGNFDINQSVLLPPPFSQCPGEDELNGAQDISVDDINHDGWPDIVLYYSNCVTPIVQLLINNKSGGFNDETEQRIPPHETSVFGNPRFQVADVDGNRSPDIIFEGHQEDFSVTPYYFLNDGTGNFTRDNPMLDWYLGSQLIMVDLNGDGVMDQVDTACESYGEGGCLSRSWYKRIIQVNP